MLTVAEFAEKVADYMDSHGKSVGVSQDMTGAVCIMGAMQKAYGELDDSKDDYVSYYRDMYKAIIARINMTDAHMSIPEFSDSHTHGEVVKLLYQVRDDLALGI